MLCEMPVLNLPTEFTSTNDTRREGTAVSTLRTPNATLNLYIGFTLDNLPTFRNLSKSRPGISFTLNPLQVSFAEPPDTPVEFDPSVNKYLLIKVCVSDALLVINNLRQTGYVCASASEFVCRFIGQQDYDKCSMKFLRQYTLQRRRNGAFEDLAAKPFEIMLMVLWGITVDLWGNVNNGITKGVLGLKTPLPRK